MTEKSITADADTVTIDNATITADGGQRARAPKPDALDNYLALLGAIGIQSIIQRAAPSPPDETFHFPYGD